MSATHREIEEGGRRPHSQTNYQLAGKIIELVKGHAADPSHTGLIWKIEALLAAQRSGPEEGVPPEVIEAAEWYRGVPAKIGAMSDFILRLAKSSATSDDGK